MFLNGATIRPIPRDSKHVCGFCGTKLDVKYEHLVESTKDYPEESRASDVAIYCCSACSLKRILSRL